MAEKEDLSFFFDEGSEKKKTKEFLDSGVKRLFILALTPLIPETYSNVKRELDALNVTTVSKDLITVADLKLHNVLSGISSHRSDH